MRYYDSHENEGGSLRGTWDLNYSVASLIDASIKQAKYRQSRIDWWQKESQEAETKLKEKGFEYRESRMSDSTGMSIVGDPELAKRAHLCQEKITDHKKALNGYKIWIRALNHLKEREPQAELTLKFNDIEFFGL